MRSFTHGDSSALDLSGASPGCTAFTRSAPALVFTAVIVTRLPTATRFPNPAAGSSKRFPELSVSSPLASSRFLITPPTWNLRPSASQARSSSRRAARARRQRLAELELGSVQIGPGELSLARVTDAGRPLEQPALLPRQHGARSAHRRA